MLFKNSLQNIFGNKNKVKVLRFLFQHKIGAEFTESELARLSNVPVQTLNRLVKGLINSNLVIGRRVGNARLISLNSKHPLFEEISSLMKAENKKPIQELKRLIKAELKKTELKECWIFGSVARGDKTPESDIDILMVGSDKDKLNDIGTDLSLKVKETLGNTVSIVTARVSEFHSPKSDLMKTIQTEGIRVQ